MTERTPQQQYVPSIIFWIEVSSAKVAVVASSNVTLSYGTPANISFNCEQLQFTLKWLFEKYGFRGWVTRLAYI